MEWIAPVVWVYFDSQRTSCGRCLDFGPFARAQQSRWKHIFGIHCDFGHIPHKQAHGRDCLVDYNIPEGLGIVLISIRPPRPEILFMEIQNIVDLTAQLRRISGCLSLLWRSQSELSSASERGPSSAHSATLRPGRRAPRQAERRFEYSTRQKKPSISLLMQYLQVRIFSEDECTCWLDDGAIPIEFIQGLAKANWKREWLGKDLGKISYIPAYKNIKNRIKTSLFYYGFFLDW